MADNQNYPIREKQLGDWKTVAELENYAIVRTVRGGLLGVSMADVLFSYKLKTGQTEKDRKRLHIYGPEIAVWKRAVNVIERKKNPSQRAMMIEKFNKDFQDTKFTYTTKTSPGTLLGRAIENTGYTARQFAEKTGLKAPTLYHHVSGGREISREIAMEYAKKLNCDPVDLMFDKKLCPVWAKVDLLKSTELEDTYAPGRLFSYVASDKDFDTVIVPRDLYREDIKAIKIIGRGSMYDNKIAFYYRAENKENNILNQLCVVGVEEPFGPPELEETETRYYFGLYEEIRGQCNLINPDPYSGDLENKFILRNFKPQFITPVAALVNPDAVKDQTDLKKTIPQSALFRKEEMLQAEIEKMKRELAEKYKKENELDEVVKLTKANAKKIADKAQLLEKVFIDKERQLQLELRKVSEAIQKQLYEQNETAKLDLFQKMDEKIERSNRVKLKVIGGKK